MSIEKPYYRIIRPFKDKSFIISKDYLYVKDINYSSDRINLIRSYKLLENDLIELYNYIEPNDNNLKCFSLRTFELLLRACTEFETNAKAILRTNDYVKKDNNNKVMPEQKWNIKDYKKLNASSKLSEYIIKLNNWGESGKKIKPFEEFNTKDTLTWYSNYNSSKHDRRNNINLANFESVVNSIASVLVILFSQFSTHIINYKSDINTFSIITDTHEISFEDSIFTIIPPNSWSDDEKYCFNIQPETDYFEYQKFNFGT